METIKFTRNLKWSVITWNALIVQKNGITPNAKRHSFWIKKATTGKNKNILSPLYRAAASILFFENETIERVKIGGINENRTEIENK